MKLDRNKNPDGRGKYALIKLRELSQEDFTELIETPRHEENYAILPATCLHLGNEREGQFFVLKYRDKFAAAALKAYADAVRKAAKAEKNREQKKELQEYAAEIDGEVAIAKKIGKQVPS